MKVYDLDGNEHDKESVDVAECIRLLGWTTEPPAPKSDETINSENTGSENTQTVIKKKGAAAADTPPAGE